LPPIFSSLSTPSPTKSSSNNNNSSSNLSLACFSVHFRRFSLRRE
jgi:hypothetical protein